MLKILKQSYRRYRSWLRDILIGQKMRKKLINREFTIISCNCIGGLIYHDLKMEFSSPTINLFIPPQDFVRFIKDMEYWVRQPMIEIKDEDLKKKYSYPIVELGENGVRVHLAHYNSIDEAQKKWNERVSRIKWDNLYFILDDRNDCAEEVIYEYDKLPYEHKIFFSHREYPEVSCARYIKGFENASHVGIMTAFVNPISCKRNYDQFDFVTWFNQGNI